MKPITLAILSAPVLIGFIAGFVYPYPFEPKFRVTCFSGSEIIFQEQSVRLGKAEGRFQVFVMPDDEKRYVSGDCMLQEEK